MAAKKKDEEPSVELAIARCPKATMNPTTGEPFSDWTIRQIMTEDCYDFDPACPWRFQTKLQKVFLPDELKVARCAMATAILSQHRDPAWWFRNVVWFDPCASILPGSLLQYKRMRQAAAGSKAWASDDARRYSPNLRGPEQALKQKTWDGTKVNWFMVLAKGRVHVELMPQDWALDSAGLAEFVRRLPGILRRLLGLSARLPKVVFTDRGTGMYSPQGFIAGAYEQALADAGFKAYLGCRCAHAIPRHAGCAIARDRGRDVSQAPAP